MSTITRITQKLIAFREARNWQQFHRPKDLAISLTLEATELLELFQWKNDEDVAAHIRTHKEQYADELADIFNWVLILAHDLDISIEAAAEAKIEKNGHKYPLELSRNSYQKYTQFSHHKPKIEEHKDT